MGWQGSGANARRNKAAKGRVTVELVVHALEEEAATRRAPWLPCAQRPVAVKRNVCFISTKDEGFAAEAARSGSDGVCLLYARTFPQCVVSAVPCDDLPAGVVLLSEHQRKNLEVTVGDAFPFSVFTDACDVLSDVTVSVMPRHALPPGAAAVDIDGLTLARTVKQFLFQTVVHRHELFLLDFQGCPLVAYISECNVPFDPVADAAAVVVADTFRGVVSSGTTVGLVINEKAATVDPDRFIVRNPPQVQPPPKPRFLVHVITSDDELIPVKKKLLLPCLSFASAVCEGKGKYAAEFDPASSDAPEVRIDFADCCEFDRVLLYLEAAAAGTGDSFGLTPGEEEVLLPIAEKLGCRGLVDVCRRRQGAFEERVRKDGILWEEVTARNAADECLILIDGAVYDITRWLPEHPGGNTIIPKQALNLDATRFFEIYHTESAFEYLKLFYIGELAPEDARHVPPTRVPASKEFLTFLAGATPWRVKGAIKGAHKSF